MSLSAAAGSLQSGTGAVGTTITVSGLLFQPKVVIFFWGGQTSSTDATGRKDHKRGIGVASSPTSRWCVTSQSDDTPTTMATDTNKDEACCVRTLSITATDAGTLDMDAITSDGF